MMSRSRSQGTEVTTVTGAFASRLHLLCQYCGLSPEHYMAQKNKNERLQELLGVFIYKYLIFDILMLTSRS